MQAANVDNISVILDVAGLGEGTVTVRPTVRVPSGVQLVSINPDSATLLLSQAAPTSAPGTTTPGPASQARLLQPPQTQHQRLSGRRING